MFCWTSLWMSASACFDSNVGWSFSSCRCVRKESWGLTPEESLSVTCPDDLGFGSDGPNEGSVLPFGRRGALLPSDCYCPNIHVTEVWFAAEPFGPLFTVIAKRFEGEGCVVPFLGRFLGAFDVSSFDVFLTAVSALNLMLVLLK